MEPHTSSPSFACLDPKKKIYISSDVPHTHTHHRSGGIKGRGAIKAPTDEVEMSMRKEMTVKMNI